MDSQNMDNQDMDNQDTGNQNLHSKLAQLEAEQAIRTCINTYMTMCDSLDATTDLDKLANLFTTYAVWEGVGGYAEVFGRHNGRGAIRQMFAKYTTSPPHFSLNVHILGNEKIDISAGGKDAIARWVLLQPSTFTSGDSHLSCAKITVRFVRDLDGVWRINAFQTERQFNRPMDKAWDSGSLPVPGKSTGGGATKKPLRKSPSQRGTTFKKKPIGASGSTPVATTPIATTSAMVKSHRDPRQSVANTGVTDTERAEFTKGLVTERNVDSLAPHVQTVVLTKGVRLTPLAQDRLKKRNIKIERVQ